MGGGGVCGEAYTEPASHGHSHRRHAGMERERMVVRASPNQHPSTRGHTHASQQEVIDEWVLDGGGSVVRRPPTRRGHTEESGGGDDPPNHTPTA